MAKAGLALKRFLHFTSLRLRSSISAAPEWNLAPRRGTSRLMVGWCGSYLQQIWLAYLAATVAQRPFALRCELWSAMPSLPLTAGRTSGASLLMGQYCTDPCQSWFEEVPNKNPQEPPICLKQLIYRLKSLDFQSTALLTIVSFKQGCSNFFFTWIRIIAHHRLITGNKLWFMDVYGRYICGCCGL